MPCSLPPPLTDDQISAALDGEHDPAVQQHLARCASCAGRLEQARRLEQGLKSRLHRWDCPAPQVIGDYHFGLLDAENATRIAQHLDQCPYCRAEVEALAQFLRSDDAPARRAAARPQPKARRLPAWPGWGELVAQWMPRPLAPAFRGEVEGPLVASAEGVTIFLETQFDEEARFLTGQVVSDDETSWAGALLEVRRAGDLVTTTVLDDLGGFSCPLPDSGPFDLRVTTQDNRALLLPGVAFT